MSEGRGYFRGGRGGGGHRGGGGGGGGDRSGERGSGGHHHRGGRGRGGGGDRGGGGAGGHDRPERPKKENILDLGRYMDKEVRVKFNGGREVIGTLKGYDQLMNLVLDDVREVMHDDEGTTSSRQLGLIVARGTMLVVLSPVDGSEEIANPFLEGAE